MSVTTYRTGGETEGLAGVAEGREVAERGRSAIGEGGVVRVGGVG